MNTQLLDKLIYLHKVSKQSSIEATFVVVVGEPDPPLAVRHAPSYSNKPQKKFLLLLLICV